MLCDACRETDASVHLTKAVEGEVTLVHLCAGCAAERGIDLLSRGREQKQAPAPTTMQG